MPKTSSRPETIARRNEILEAAMDVFGSKGSTNGTLNDVAEQVGMTHAGVLHHFGSKEALLLEVLSYRDASDVKDLEGRHIPDGIELFRHLVRTAFANESRSGLVQAYTVLSAESVTEGHASRAYFVERYRTLRAEAAAALEQVCTERGITNRMHIQHAAASVLAVMDGLQVQWLLEPDNVELADASKFAIEAIVAAVLSESGPEQL